MRGVRTAGWRQSGGIAAHAISDVQGALVTSSSSSYEIRVEGKLPPEILLDFEQLTADVEPVGTVLHGQLADQAALYGLLARLEVFGVQVVEVRRLHDDQEAASPE
jgi:hypothetical protein